MKTQVVLTIVRPPATAAMILGTANPQSVNRPGAASEAASGASSDPPANPNDPERFREEILRRYEVPFRFEGWDRSGLND